MQKQKYSYKVFGLWTIEIFIYLVLFSSITPCNSFKHFSVVPNAIHGEVYNHAVNRSLEYEYVFRKIDKSLTMEGGRLKVESADATEEFPLVVVVNQKQGVLSWQIPYQVESQTASGSKILTYNMTNRMLCSSSFYQANGNYSEEFVTVRITTASPFNVSFHLTMSRVQDFYLIDGEERNVTIAPSEPIYYAFMFSSVNYTTMVIEVDSKSDICMTMSIQNVTCPVFDLEQNVAYSGYRQTVSRKGAITVSRQKFPKAFFTVLLVKSNDEDCTGSPFAIENRRKSVTITIRPIDRVPVREHMVYLAIILIVMALSCFVPSTCCWRLRCPRNKKRNDSPELCNVIAMTSVADASLMTVNVEITTQNVIHNNGNNVSRRNSYHHDHNVNQMVDVDTSDETIRGKIELFVSDLTRKSPRVLRLRAQLYLLYIIPIAVFYTLPVIQLVTTDQYRFALTGNQDICYYNFLCSHPWSFLSDYNHVLSNSVYVLLGILFLLITRARDKSNAEDEENLSVRCFTGIPQHYGLFYAMGVALIMMGVLSGCYHFCPNKNNFQHDASFMYIISILSTIKIYQSRHPDICARASMTFSLLAIVLSLNIIGTLVSTRTYYIMFTTFHLAFCLSSSTHMYYMGTCKFNRGIVKRAYAVVKRNYQSGIKTVLYPNYFRRFLLLLAGNFYNVGLSVYGMMHNANDFTIHLFLSNLLLYFVYYLVMKTSYRETIRLEPTIYCALSVLIWVPAFYYFFEESTSWSLTPAQSRFYNKPCLLFDFFDTHDVWHFLSASAMFFSFMALLTLDDDLKDVPRNKIPVF